MWVDRKVNKKYLKHVLSVIKHSKPDVSGELPEKGFLIGNEAVFRFVAGLVGIEGFNLLLEQELEEICFMWYSQYEAELDKLGLSFDEAWIKFVDAIPRVKYVNNAFNIALEKALSNSTVPEAELFEDKNLKLLVSFCFYLQKTRLREQPFWLSGRDVGIICNKSQSWGHLMLRELVRRGILQIVTKGHTGRATEYLYVSLLTNTENVVSAGVENKREANL